MKFRGEVIAAENPDKAARTMAGAPGALHLRTLNTQLMIQLKIQASHDYLCYTEIEVL